jgi:hypothetical protein
VEDAGFKLCPSCAQRIRASAIKCRFCGTWLEEPQLPPAASPAAGVTSQPAADPPLLATKPDEPTTTPNQKPRKLRQNYVARHWRGDLSLAASYWINCFLLSIAYVAVSSALIQPGAEINVWSAVPIIAALFILFPVTTCWQIVGTLRSAGKHASRGGNPAMAILAKVVMALWIAVAAKSLITDWIPLGTGIWRAVQSTRAMPTCRVRVLPGGEAVEIAGGLPPGSADKLEAVLNQNPRATVVYVNSIGGLIREGQKAGQVVRRKGLSTYTEGCASAAALIFICGKERTISEGAKIGFHAPEGYGMWAGEKTFYDSTVRETMTDAGITQDFITRVLATPNKELWFPSIEEMRLAHVITKEDAPIKAFTSSVLSIMENPTNADNYTPIKTGHRDLDDLMGFISPFFGRWGRLFDDMSSELDADGEIALYSDETLGGESALRNGVALEEKRQEIIERYRSKAHQEIQNAKSNLFAMKLSDPSAASMLKGFTNSIEKGRVQADELLSLRLQAERDRQRFLNFMAGRFSTYRLAGGKIRFASQADTDRYEALSSAVTESRKALEDFSSKMLKTADDAKTTIKQMTQ